MEPADAVVLLVAVGMAAGVVLRDIAAYGRPPVVKAPRAPREDRRAERPRPRQPAREPVAASYEPVPATSMLASLGTVEQDEHSAARRVVAALVLLTLTLLTAALIGAGIYRGLSRFGGN